ncbi:hypothetical protein [Stackebrandtia soli]|uniref:hypothetical protein n=1 Tax=Stackebrandtia soli TaxID=1892856 RepID=UPI0039E9FFEC
MDAEPGIPDGLNDELKAILAEGYPEVDAVDATDYNGEVGNALDALSYFRLFWPETFIHHGAVFVCYYGGMRADVIKGMSGDSGRPSAVWTWEEAVNSWNRVEPHHMFRNYPVTYDSDLDTESILARALIVSWSGCLKAKYPDRHFAVTLDDPDPHSGPWLQVTQISPKLVTPQGWQPMGGYVKPSSSSVVDGGDGADDGGGSVG